MWSYSTVKHRAEQQMAYLHPRHKTIVDMVCNTNVDVNAYLLSVCIMLTLMLKERKPPGNFSVSIIWTELNTINSHITRGKTSLQWREGLCPCLHCAPVSSNPMCASNAIFPALFLINCYEFHSPVYIFSPNKIHLITQARTIPA